MIAKRLPYFLDAGVPLEITGPSGIGKSEVLVQVVSDLAKRDGHEWGLGRHFLATYTPPDVTGYLSMHEQEIIDHLGVTSVQPVSIFSQPPWMLDDNGKPLNSFKRGVCCAEEADKANPEVKKAYTPVMLSGAIAHWRFHMGISRVMLTNDASSSRQGSTKDFDFAINRRTILKASTSVQGWLAWAYQNGVDPLFVAFAESHVATVFSGAVPEKQGPFCTPRSLVSLSKVAKFLMDEEGRLTDKDGMAEISAGTIGDVGTRDLMTWLEFRDDVPNWSEIVKAPGTAKIPENASGQLMVAHQCAFNVDDDTCEQAVRYVRRLRPEFHITFAKAATRRNFRLVNSKPFEKWTDEEPQLVALLNAVGGAR
jgi:hypothetical protein